MSNKHHGSTLTSLFDELGEREELEKQVAEKRGFKKIPDDVFRWKCQAILEGMLEGATYEETKQSLYNFAMKYAHNEQDWSKVPIDAELSRRAFDLLGLDDD